MTQDAVMFDPNYRESDDDRACETGGDDDGDGVSSVWR
jgi:hypothetical protein